MEGEKRGVGRNCSEWRGKRGKGSVRGNCCG